MLTPIDELEKFGDQVLKLAQIHTPPTRVDTARCLFHLLIRSLRYLDNKK